MDPFVYFQSPTITIATNKFIDVPIILQYEDVPLIEVVRFGKTGYKTQIPIYYPDGTYIAKVVGTRIVKTEAGKNAGLILKYPKNMTVCELNGKTLFEIIRTGPAAISVSAELYTNDGAFVKCPTDLLPLLFVSDKEVGLQISGVTLLHNTISGFRIGILIKKDGSLGSGVNL